MHFGVVAPHDMIFSCISNSRLSYVQRFFFEGKLVKTSLRTQLKQINLESRFHILKESLKEGFNDTIFKHFMAELKHCNLVMRKLTTTNSSVFVFVFNIFGCYVTFKNDVFCFISFSYEFAII